MQCCFFFLVVFLSLHVTGPFPVRLTGGPNLCAGRVELFHQGKWGTVCDDDWDMRDAAVVCRELDCGEALSAPHGAWFGEGPGPIWLNEVRCAGTEWHLHSCRHLGFRKHVCTHEEDASAICSEQRFPPFTAFPPHTTFRRGKMDAVTTASPLVSLTPAQGAPALRLTGGRSHCSGRVEVFHEGQWGTICDDMWDLLDVAVVCRELDCGEALAAPGGAFFGEGNSVIWLDDVQCQGEESGLEQCHTSPWGTNNCRHSEDAGAVCSGEMPLAMVEERVAMLTRTLPPQRLQSVAPKRIPHPTQPSRRQKEPVVNEVSHTGPKKPKESLSERILGGRWQIRLEGGPGSCAGRVEVLYKEQWGTVCDDGWDLVDATVVCRELGCGAPLLSPGNARYGPGSGPIWLDDVNCTGSEFTLRRCRSQPWGKHNCNHHEDASVICTGKWKPVSFPKPSGGSSKSTPKATTITSTTTTTTTITTTTQDSRLVDGPVLQSTLDVLDTTRATQDFPNEWETGTLQPWYLDNPSGAVQNVELELEQNTNPESPMNILETTANPEILLPVQEMESTSIPKKRTTIYTWVQKDTVATMPNPEILQQVQEMSSTSPPETKPYTDEWERESIYASTESQPSSTMPDVNSERKIETTTHWGMDKTIADLETLKNVQVMESPSSPKSTSSQKWEQKPTYATVVSQPTSTLLDLESKRETDTTTHRAMDRSTPDLEILQNGEEMELTRSPNTRPSPHKWGQKPTSSSTEFLPSLVTGDLQSETEAESTTTSKMELPTIIETIKPATDTVPFMHWSNMSEVPHITQDVEPFNPTAEVQPSTATQEPAKNRETTDKVRKEQVLLSKSLEATGETELPTATENMHLVKHMEATYSEIPGSGENTSQEQQEGSSLYTIQPTETTFTLNDVSSLDETDTHNTTEEPQSPVLHTVSSYSQSEDGFMSSGDTESGTSYTDIDSASGTTKPPGPDISFVKTVTSSAKFSESSSGCPVRQEPSQEQEGFHCSSPALGNLVQAVEGLRGDLRSLSATIQRQGSQMDAIAYSLADLAVSVRHLVGALPALGSQASVPSHRKDEDQLHNQLPLK